MSIESFENFEEMMKAMRERMDAADNKIQSWQALIRLGEYFIRKTNLGFDIYGQILKDPEELRRGEYTENYRFARCFSTACPAGELGDIHVSTIERILSKEEFDQAKRSGWR